MVGLPAYKHKVFFSLLFFKKTYFVLGIAN